MHSDTLHQQFSYFKPYRCPTYTNIPSGCRLEKVDECCSDLVCPDSVVVSKSKAGQVSQQLPSSKRAEKLSVIDQPLKVEVQTLSGVDTQNKGLTKKEVIEGRAPSVINKQSAQSAQRRTMRKNTSFIKFPSLSFVTFLTVSVYGFNKIATNNIIQKYFKCTEKV